MIRNFLYLDSDKLRSLSSQVFEGVVEEVIRISEEENSESEQQRGKLASGRLLGDIFRQKTSASERAFLDDHAYSLFEEKLKNDKILVEAGASGLQPGAFVRASGKLTINDNAHSARILRNFNALGESFWRVTNDPMLVETGPNAAKPTSDPQAKIKAAEGGFQLHSKTVEASAYIMEFGYGQLIEFNVDADEKLFSSPLRREFLREREDIIVAKYSRSPQQDFSLVGIITQVGSVDEPANQLANVGDAPSIKEAMRLLAQHANIFETTFSKPQFDEYIVDPIAIYCEI